MKAKFVVKIVFIILLTPVMVGKGRGQQLPAAFLPETKYEFEAVADGTKIVHDFILKNTGSAPLHIKKVLTG